MSFQPNLLLRFVSGLTRQPRALTALTLVCLPQIILAKPAKSLPKYYINAASTETDGSVVLHGSHTVVANNLNILRRGYKIGGVTTVTPPPKADLGSLGTPSSPKTNITVKDDPTKKALSPQVMTELVMGLDAGGGKSAAKTQRSTSRSQDTVDPKVNAFADKVAKLLTEVETYHDKVQALKDAIDSVAAQENNYTTRIESNTAILKSSANSLSSLLDRSDQLLANDNHPLFDAAVHGVVAPGTSMSAAYNEAWPIQDGEVALLKAAIRPITVQVATLKSNMARSRKAAEDLKAGAPPVQHDWSPATRNAYKPAAGDLINIFDILDVHDADIKPADDDIKKLSMSADSFSPGSSDGLAFDKLRQTLDSWYDYLKPLDKALQDNAVRITDHAVPGSEDPLSLSLDVRCDTFTADKAVTIVSLTASPENVVDLTPVTTKPKTQSPAPEAKSTSKKLVTVTCETPIILAVGVGFSSIPDREFSIQQIGSTISTTGATVPSNVFSQTTNSNFHPLPLAAVHTGLGLWGSVPIYASVAVAANIKSQNSGGSSAEYLIGPSIGLFRYSFLTAGLHVGRETTLAGGFKPGDQVPSGVTTPPLRTSYRAGFGIAITFSK